MSQSDTLTIIQWRVSSSMCCDFPGTSLSPHNFTAPYMAFSLLSRSQLCRPILDSWGIALKQALYVKEEIHHGTGSRLSLTFNEHRSCYFRRTKYVFSSAYVSPFIQFGGIQDSQGPIWKNSYPENYKKGFYPEIAYTGLSRLQTTSV